LDAKTERPILILASPSSQPGPHPGWVDRLVCAWPEPRPVIRRMTLELLADRSFQMEPGSVVVIWLGPNSPEGELFRALDRVSCLEVPVLVLAEEPDAIGERTPRGVLTRRRDSDPALIAIVLRALAERQGAVSELIRDRSRMLSAQAGLMNQMETMLDELTLAAQIQQELIPRHGPEIDGVDLAVICRPAGYVSGDLFHVVALDDEHVGFFLADAVGHGVPAALFTLLIARSLEPKDDAGRIRPAAEVLASLNAEMMVRNSTGSRFATGVYGVLNIETGEAEIAGAGHPAPIITRSGGVERVETNGPLLGVFEDAEFDAQRIVLEAGDAIVIFSDGFENAFPSTAEDAYSLRLPTQDYLDHLAAFGRDCCESGAFEDATRRFEAALDGQLGSLHQPDDITALVISPSSKQASKREAA
jgi:phosphoserine phosphatase RsbU/P